MRTVFRLVVGAALLGALAVAVSSSASAAPTLNPTFSFSVTVPPTVARGATVPVSYSITNLTRADAVAHVSWRLVPPKTTAVFGPLSGHLQPITVPAGQTVSGELSFKIPPRAPLGTYTLTVTVQGAAAPIALPVIVT